MPQAAPPSAADPMFFPNSYPYNPLPRQKEPGAGRAPG